MSKTRVGVLRGGVGCEYEVSLSTGAGVLKNLDQNKYEANDILITRDGLWHYKGLPILPAELPKYIDVAFNALHGEFGEDGQVQGILNNLGLPFTGSDRYGSSLGMNKYEVKEILKDNDILTPRGLVLEKSDQVFLAASEVFKKISPPWIVKPMDKGSSVGVYLAKTFKELELAIQNSLRFSDYVLVEEYIRGKESTCGAVDNFRNHEIYSFPAIEVLKPANNFWSYEDKYSGLNNSRCPGYFSESESEQIQVLTKKIHKLLGLRHYSRSDFIVSPRGVYALEVNTLPGLSLASPLSKSMEAVGLSYSDFLDHILDLALTK